MVGFVIPFKSRMKSKNWELDCALLNRTIHSVLNQTDENFRCYVVYSDLPGAPAQNSKVTWIQFPFPFLESHQIEDEERSAVKYGLGKFLPNFYDQGKKSLYGSSFAKTDNCTYIMSLDADDLLSDRLAGFVNKNASADNHGWYVDKGYMYAEKASFLIKVPRNMNYVCASVNIISSQLVPEPDFLGKSYQDFQFFSSHAYMKESLKMIHNIDLQPIPFYSLTYVIHSSNFFTDSSQITKLNFRNIAKRIMRGKYLTKNTRKEFGLYNLVV